MTTTTSASTTTAGPTTTTTTTIPGTTEGTLQYSTAASRANSAPLSGSSLGRSSSVYVHYATAITYSTVSFWIDNPNRTGGAFHVEINPPYDLNNGSVASANAYSLSGLTPGTHSITVSALRANGTSFVTTSTFTVV